MVPRHANHGWKRLSCCLILSLYYVCMCWMNHFPSPGKVCNRKINKPLERASNLFWVTHAIIDSLLPLSFSLSSLFRLASTFRLAILSSLFSFLSLSHLNQTRASYLPVICYFFRSLAIYFHLRSSNIFPRFFQKPTLSQHRLERTGYLLLHFLSTTISGPFCEQDRFWFYFREFLGSSGWLSQNASSLSFAKLF